jgi:hypothetical protein
MADAAVFIGWGAAIPGRERHALQVFTEALQYYASLQQQGEIESFEAVSLDPHGGDLAGFVLLRGEREKLNRLRDSAEVRRLMGFSEMTLNRFGVVDAHIGEDLNRRFAELYAQLDRLT